MIFNYVLNVLTGFLQSIFKTVRLVPYVKRFLCQSHVTFSVTALFPSVVISQQQLAREEKDVY